MEGQSQPKKNAMWYLSQTGAIEDTTLGKEMENADSPDDSAIEEEEMENADSPNDSAIEEEEMENADNPDDSAIEEEEMENADSPDDSAIEEEMENADNPDDSAIEDEVHNSGEKRRLRKKYPPGVRKQRNCAMCGGRYLYLSQHMRRIHRIIDPKRLKAELGRAREKEPISKGSVYACPYPGCPSKGLRRLDVHVNVQHQVKRQSTLFRSLMTKAKFTRGIRTHSTNCPPKEKLSSACDVYRKPSQDDVLQSFHEYVHVANGCSDGAAKTAKATVQNVRLLQGMMGVTLPKLVQQEMPQRIVVKLCEANKQPGTVTKYLLAVKKFAHFLSLYDSHARALGVKMPVVHKTILMAEEFIRSTRPRVNARQAELKSHICDVLIDGELVNKFLEMSATELKSLTNKRNDSSMLCSEVTRVRNLIIVNLLLCQAPRAGVIQNCTLGEYRTRKSIAAPDTFELVSVIEVRKHKTSQAGPASLILFHDMEEWVKYYVRYARPQTKGSSTTDIAHDDSPLFLAPYGRPVYKVAQEVQRCWTSMGLPGNITPTSIRKTAATKAVRELTRKDADHVAELMAHQTATQQQYYVASQEARMKVKASAMLSSVMKMSKSSCNGAINKEVAKSDVEQQDDNVEDDVEELPSSKAALACPDEKEPEDQGHVASSSQAVPVNTFYKCAKQKQEKKPRKYTKQQQTILHEEFRKFKRTTGEKKAYKKAATFIHQNHKEFGEFTVKQLSDKIRHMEDKLLEEDPIPALTCDISGHQGKAETSTSASDHKKRIAEMTDTEISTLMKSNKKHFRNIFSGEAKCWRHDHYKQGQAKRDALRSQGYAEPFSEDQQELILQCLTNDYCRHGTLYLDYLCKVLLPEAMLKIVQDLCTISREKAEEVLGVKNKY